MGCFGMFDKATLHYNVSGASTRRLSLDASNALLQDPRILTLIMAVKVAGVTNGPVWIMLGALGSVIFCICCCCCCCHSHDRPPPSPQKFQRQNRIVNPAETRPLMHQQMQQPEQRSWLSCCTRKAPPP